MKKTNTPKNTPKKVKKTTKKVKTKTAKEKRLENLQPAWKPGESGNPKGGPKGPRMTTMLNKLLSKAHPQDSKNRKWLDLLVLKTMDLAMKGNPAALKEVWNRTDGKVADTVNIIPHDAIGEKIKDMDNKRLNRELKETRARLKKLKK